MKKQDIYNRIIGDAFPYKGIIYLACCIGVKYDYDIVSHFVEHYRGLGVDEFLIILNNNDSKRLKEVQNILRGYGIKEKDIWAAQYHPVEHTSRLMDMVEENTNQEDWVITIDIDEFHEYFCDLRIFIGYLKEKYYEYITGKFVDRFAKNGKIINIDKGGDLFKTFPLKINVFGDKFPRERKMVQKIMLHKSYIKLCSGQHDCFNQEEYKCFPNLFNIHHFKWRGNYIENQKERINIIKNIDSDRFSLMIKYHEEPLLYLEKHGSIL